MPVLKMEVFRYGQRWIAHIALYVYPLYVIWLINSCWPPYGYCHIQLHASSNSWCFQSYGWCMNVYPGSYVRWLYWQRRCGLYGVCVDAVCHRLTHLMKRQSICSIRIRFHLAEVIVSPWFAGVAMERKMITKWSGKSWGIYSWLQVIMEWVTANMWVLLKMNPAAYGGMLQGIPSIPQFAVSWSDDEF